MCKRVKKCIKVYRKSVTDKKPLLLCDFPSSTNSLIKQFSEEESSLMNCWTPKISRVYVGFMWGKWRIGVWVGQMGKGVQVGCW